MKLTGILKDKVDKAETMEAKKDIIADAGMGLTDEELEGIAGGRGGHAPFSVYCYACQQCLGINLTYTEAKHLQTVHRIQTGHLADAQQ